MIKGIYTTNIAIKNLDKPIARYQSVFRVKAERLGEQTAPTEKRLSKMTPSRAS